MNKPGRPKLPDHEKRVKINAMVSRSTAAKIEAKRVELALGVNKRGRALDALLS